MKGERAEFSVMGIEKERYTLEMLGNLVIFRWSGGKGGFVTEIKCGEGGEG